MSYPGNIHTGHGDDLLQILKGFFRFQEEDDGNLLIRLGKDVGFSSPIKIVGDAEGHSSPALRRVLELADADVLCSTSEGLKKPLDNCTSPKVP
jgi:hypothetical protein